MVTLLSEEEDASEDDSELELSSEKSLSFFFFPRKFPVTEGFEAADGFFAASDGFDDDLVAYLDLALGCAYVFL